ncbi:hypothetical protein [Sneathiella sp.]|jgi:hypothetical protein|uniref:hypothetical protein n=1 Tax=Sneathiella sp. TaxID=1964365 RepID=UPI0039E715A1
MLFPKQCVLVLFLAFSMFLSSGQSLKADALLDGKVFIGKIGPEEAPDLPDSLHFKGGYFWSDICTRCGFQPGVYSSERMENGIAFTGILESESRGQFKYKGLVRANGTIEVAIEWERRRWYWTSRREIAFRGVASLSSKTVSLEEIRKDMDRVSTDTNPLCTRF